MWRAVWICLCWVALGFSEHAPQVTVSQGRLRGIHLRSRGGRSFSAFEGIPYAAPPIGLLRFQKPQPAEPWEGVRQASKPGNLCIQSPQLLNSTEVTGDEDCLYLNVYTHKVSNESRTPVLVFIHGGGFFEGSGDSYRPDFLMDKDIVLVTFNYRLGPLGFLSFEDKEMPGNNGLKDQTAALRWIRDNIAQFGGDPNTVTISGESAGAASVHYHMISPLSKGLFHRAIAQSGSALSPWATHATGQLRDNSERFAANLGCNHFNIHETLDCLRDMPAYVLVSVSRDLYEWHMDPTILFMPAIEPEDVEDAFLTSDPWKLESDVPWIAGLTSAEGAFKVAMFESKHIVELNDDFELIAPVTLFFRETAEDPVRTALAIKKFYFLDSDLKPEDFDGLTDMYSDSWFVYPVLEAVRRHKGPTYLYYLTYRGANSLIPHCQRVSHFDDMQYFYPINGFLKNFNVSAEDKPISEKLIDLWTNFVIYGKPTIIDGKLDITWTPFGTGAEYLSIGKDEIVMKKDLLKERDSFWQSLPYREKHIPVGKVIGKDRDEL